MATKYYNANDAGGDRTGGPYLDKVQAKAANDDRKARGDSSTGSDTEPHASIHVDTAEGLMMKNPVVVARGVADYDNAIGATPVANI